ncbi:MAG: hypothetical protein D6732_22460 [Methanobacteriota archaeon]|nr:MAG: hypothetical protein D6732_22460 [Euryarchaeota archaeon]
MATTIKVNDATKEKLDRLRARLLLMGKKMKQEDLLDFIVSMAESSELIFKLEPYGGLSESERQEFFDFTFRTKKSDRTIDEEIYST